MLSTKTLSLLLPLFLAFSPSTLGLPQNDINLSNVPGAAPPPADEDPTTVMGSSGSLTSPAPSAVLSDGPQGSGIPRHHGHHHHGGFMPPPEDLTPGGYAGGFPGDIGEEGIFQQPVIVSNFTAGLAGATDGLKKELNLTGPFVLKYVVLPGMNETDQEQRIFIEGVDPATVNGADPPQQKPHLPSRLPGADDMPESGSDLWPHLIPFKDGQSDPDAPLPDQSLSAAVPAASKAPAFYL